jgi:hypothetical protein
VDTVDFDYSGRSRACDLLIGIDEPLYKVYEKNMTRLKDMAQERERFD